jgi:hypothetical protein
MPGVEVAARILTRPDQPHSSFTRAIAIDASRQATRMTREILQLGGTDGS